VSTDELAAEIVGRCRERIDAGEDVDVDAVVRAHPEIAATLRARFDALARLDRGFGRARAKADAWAASLVGRTLGAWRLASVLGSGGMGTVFLAEDDGTRAAVKVVHPHLLTRRGYVERFLREADIGRRVRHPNVVATVDARTVETDGRTLRILVMEHVEGRTLRAFADELGRVPEELCRHVGREVAKALAAIHAAGAVHRDLKPENLIVTRDHVVKVMDLGVARLADEAMRLSQTGAFVGSVRYAAPEQFGGGDVDGRVDLYALGLTLYELATGRHPFEGDDFRAVVRQQLTETPRPAGEVNPQLSPFFEEMLRRLLEKDRDARFASAEELLRVLEDGESSAWWRERALSIRAETRRPLRRIRIPRETALYGRDAELAKLRESYEKAKAGDGQVVLIEGEAGIGKSRLVDEFVGLLQRGFVVPASAGTLPSGAAANVPPEGGTTNQAEDVNFLYGSYPPGGAATASGAFTSAYREHLGDDEAALRAALPATPLLVPAFAALLKGDAAPADAEKLTKDSLQTVFVHATRSFAATRTTVVLIDDLHFAPDEGRSLFAALALGVPGHRILLVGTARPEIDEKWVARGEHVSRIALPRLGAKDLVRLLADSLRSTHLAEELAGKIATKSDGNPYFVFEILRGLRDGQFLTRRPDGTWATTRLIAEIDVPPTVRDLIFARVGSLSTAERNLLDVAACAGFEFDPVLAGEVLRLDRIAALQRLAAVEKSHGLVRSSGRRFVFDHHQVAEVLYAGLPEMLREEYHAALGAAIEARSGAASKEPKDLDGALCVDLAEHFLAGAQGAKALRYLDSALTHLEKRYLNDPIIRLTDRALAVPGLVAGRERCKLLWRKADRVSMLGRRDAQRAILDEANALAGADGDPALRAGALCRLGILHSRMSRTDEARAVFVEALALARRAGDRKEEAEVRGRLALLLRDLDLLGESREQYEQALVAFRDIGDRWFEGRTTGELGVLFLNLGRHGEAQEHLARSIVLAREAGDRRGEGIAIGNLGIVFHVVGRFAEAREHYERHLALSRETGDRAVEALAVGNLGSLLWSLGHSGEALEHVERAAELSREIGERAGDAAGTKNVGGILAHLGRLGDARRHLERCVVLAREIGDRRTEGAALNSLASVAWDEGDAAAAERLHAEALALRLDIGDRVAEAEALCALGALVARLGRTDEARTKLGGALSIARELSLPYLELVATAELASLPGGDVAAALAALAAHEVRAERHEAMQVRFLIWQATRDPSHLAKAKSQLDFLVEHAPADCRESMLANVRLHREIAAAAREQGLPLAADSRQPGPTVEAR
jgi:serine/threonine protein kinase/tetratricopeptide (TPR) repeat protein